MATADGNCRTVNALGRPRRGEQVRMPLKRGYGVGVAQEVSRGLPPDVVGPARTIAFGTSIVAPSASAVTVLVLVLAYAGFASPLVILITFAGRCAVRSA